MNIDKKFFEDWKMKPLMIVPRGSMSQEDIKVMRENHLCVVEAENPSAVKFIDSLPAVSSRTDIESAAIRLSRKIINPGFWSSEDTRREMAAKFIDLLVSGTALDPAPTKAEASQQFFDAEKRAELSRLARLEAKEERDAARLLRGKKTTPTA